MVLNNRVVLYSWNHRKVDYLNPYDTTTDLLVKVYQLGEPITFFEIPRYCKTPRDIEMYCSGLENALPYIKIERCDYEY